jgi:D-3-phosphoglycerate dehydrogenase
MQFTNKKVLIVDKMHESIFSMLAAIGFQADYQPSISREEIYKLIGGYEIIFVRSKISIDDRLLKAAPSLKLVGRAGAGIDQVDMEALNRRGIGLINAPEGNRDAVAEHAVGMLLCLLNKMQLADRQVRDGIWNREGNRGLELREKTVGIIGYGYMGQAFAKRLQGFGCRIMAYDKYHRDFAHEEVEECSLEEIMQEAEILSLHIPLTAETRFMVDKAFLARFRKNIFLINTARGEILPLKDLQDALESGKVRGAALDVMENEKLHELLPEQEKVFRYLVNCDRVLFTPHVAGWTQESYIKINKTLVEKLKVLST